MMAKKNSIQNTEFEGNNKVGANTLLDYCNFGYASYIGNNSRLSYALVGKYTCIASNVKNDISSLVRDRNSGEVDGLRNASYINEIGSDVWIGEDVVIRAGVKIGDGAIIATGAVVECDVEPYSIVGGVPAKHIRYRFSHDQIDMLLKFCWWNKSIEWLRNNAYLFSDVDNFFEKIVFEENSEEKG